MTVQRDEAWVRSHTAEEIVAAQEAGELNILLGRPVPLPKDRQLTEADLVGRSAEEVTAAHAAGQLADILSRPRSAPRRDTSAATSSDLSSGRCSDSQ
jgi:hypothetical protein